MYLISKDKADQYLAARVKQDSEQAPRSAEKAKVRFDGGVPVEKKEGSSAPGETELRDEQATTKVVGFSWTGALPHQKWMNFYTKVLSRFATNGGLSLTITVNVAPPGGAGASSIEETKNALRELGLPEQITFKSAD